MCGIVGYIGTKRAYPILIKGLQRLEYRGYDSAGVAMISETGSLNVYKAKGKVSDLEAFRRKISLAAQVLPIHAGLLMASLTVQTLIPTIRLQADWHSSIMVLSRIISP